LDDILSCDAWAREYVAENTKNVAKSSLLLWVNGEKRRHNLAITSSVAVD
jgi:hypothetical protein